MSIPWCFPYIIKEALHYQSLPGEAWWLTVTSFHRGPQCVILRGLPKHVLYVFCYRRTQTVVLINEENLCRGSARQSVTYSPSSDSLSESWLMMSFLCSSACSRAAWSFRGNSEASSSICKQIENTAVSTYKQQCSENEFADWKYNREPHALQPSLRSLWLHKLEDKPVGWSGQFQGQPLKPEKKERRLYHTQTKWKLQFPPS